MQSTYYVPDEIEQQRGLREANTLQAHSDFAEEALSERTRLVQTVKRQPVWHDLLAQAERQTWRWAVWSVEVMLMLFVVMAFSMEMWGSCPFEMGLEPVCQYCYSKTFLVWNLGLVVLWFFNLYMFLLLVSRGFVLRFTDLGSAFSENTAKGVPEGAVSTYLYLTVATLAWVVGGCFVLILSGSCDSQQGSQNERSELMFATTLLNVIAVPILLLLGRLDL